MGAEWKEQYGYFQFPNGSEVWVSGLNDDRALERVLGNEYATIYINEASEVKYSAFSLLRTRLAQIANISVMDHRPQMSQRFYVDLNPTTKQHWTYKLWIDNTDPDTGEAVDAEQYGHVIVNPMDNAANLSPEYLKDLRNLPARTRKRFYEGQYSSDDDDALWKREWIKQVKLKDNGDWPVDMKSIVVAVDPAGSSEPGSDETGIVAVGLGKDNKGYVLADESGRMKPEEWASRAIALYRSLGADRIVAEKNNGGEMVESVIRAQDNLARVKLVHASRGKVTRAEPVAALYELGRILHCDEFAQLVDQLCAVTIDFDRKKQGWSPDRMDALVWAVTDLFPTLSARRQHSGGDNFELPSFSVV